MLSTLQWSPPRASNDCAGCIGDIYPTRRAVANQRCSTGTHSGDASCWLTCHGTCCAVTCVTRGDEALTLCLAGLVGGYQVGGGGRQSSDTRHLWYRCSIFGAACGHGPRAEGGSRRSVNHSRAACWFHRTSELQYLRYDAPPWLEMLEMASRALPHVKG